MVGAEIRRSSKHGMDEIARGEVIELDDALESSTSNSEIPVSVSNLTFLSELAIRIASMADHRNVDIPSGVIDAINDPIVSDSNSPKIL